MSTPKVLILTGDAAESLEVMYPNQRLKEEGYDVQIAALTKKELHLVVHEFEPGYDTYSEKPGYSWDADLAFKDVNPSDYAALVIPGGRAPEYIRNDRDVQRIIRHFFDPGETRRPALSRAAGTGRRWSAEGQTDCRLPGSRARRQGRGRHLCRFRRR